MKNRGTQAIFETKPRKEMSDKTNIPWTDATWNFARGCTKVSLLLGEDGQASLLVEN